MTAPSSRLPDGDPFQALQEALGIAPSPEFTARIRERVRREPMRLPLWGWPRLALAGGLAVVLIAAGVLWTRPSAPPERADAPHAGRAPEASRRAGPGDMTVAGGERETASGTEAGGRSQVPAGQRIRRPGNRDRVVALVPADERVALNRLLVALREGRASVPAPPRVLTDAEGYLLEPSPIEIPPLKPIQPLPITEELDRLGSLEKKP